MRGEKGQGRGCGKAKDERIGCVHRAIIKPKTALRTRDELRGKAWGKPRGGVCEMQFREMQVRNTISD